MAAVAVNTENMATQSDPMLHWILFISAIGQRKAHGLR